MTRRERWSIPVLAALTMLLARGDWSASAARKENPLVVTLGPKVVVAQSEEEKPLGGCAPLDHAPDPGRLRVSFSQTLDSASLNTVRKHYPPGRYDSDEGGRTWQPARAGGSDGGCRLANGTAIRLQSPPAQDIPRVQLPSPAGQPDHGYHGVYLMRDPRQMPPGPWQWHGWRRAPGSETGEHLPATLDDPDGGVLCYDPPGNDHAVVRWQMLMQLVALPDNSALAVSLQLPSQP